MVSLVDLRETRASFTAFIIMKRGFCISSSSSLNINELMKLSHSRFRHVCLFSAASSVEIRKTSNCDVYKGHARKTKTVSQQITILDALSYTDAT